MRCNSSSHSSAGIILSNTAPPPMGRQRRTAGMGRFPPNAMQYGERLVLAPYQPLSSGLSIFQIERLLLRENRSVR